MIEKIKQLIMFTNVQTTITYSLYVHHNLFFHRIKSMIGFLCPITRENMIVGKLC